MNITSEILAEISIIASIDMRDGMITIATTGVTDGTRDARLVGAAKAYLLDKRRNTGTIATRGYAIATIITGPRTREIACP